MLALISFLIILIFSMLLTKIGTAALVQTGLSTQMARFQARSALTGTGFTTSESNNVVNHPVRRQIISWLMVVGSVGVVTSVSSLILTFVQVGENTAPLYTKLGIMGTGLAIVWLLASSRWLDRAMHFLVAWAFRRFTKFDVRDYANLLHLAENFAVSEIGVREEDWLCGKTLSESHLDREGLVVLGIEREAGKYIGIPHGSTKICANDILLLYGTEDAIQSLDFREKGFRGNLQRLEALARESSRAEKQKEIESEPAPTSEPKTSKPAPIAKEPQASLH